jgi:hypothetical protein
MAQLNFLEKIDFLHVEIRVDEIATTINDNIEYLEAFMNLASNCWRMYLAI